jgi:transcriptional regulator with XRE-family HTH domain
VLSAQDFGLIADAVPVRLPPVDVLKGYGAAVQKLRGERTQEEVAADAGISRGTLQSIEAERHSTTILKLDAVLRALGVGVLQFAQAIAQAQGAQIPPEFEAEIRERQRDRFKEVVSQDAPMTDDPREKLFRIQQEHIAKLEAVLNEFAREAGASKRPPNER